jgi:leader peptidase (prepilin peptidase)/N-methyltransferase
MTFDPFIGLFAISGFITASIVTWILSACPETFSPSLSEFEKPSVLEFVLFSAFITILSIAVGSGEISWGQKVVFVIFYLILVISAWTDIRENIIPNRLFLAGCINWIFLTMYSGIWITEAVFAGGILATGLGLFSYLWNRITGVDAFGMGDIKLLFLLGLYFGWEGAWLVYISICIGALFALLGIVFQRIKRNSQLPFAPFLLVGSLTGTFYLTWYEVWRWLNAF